MENREEQQEYFAEVSSEYDKKYNKPEKIIDYEKVHRLETAINLIEQRNYDKVVEIGVGSGEFFNKYPNDTGADLIGLDISFSMIKTAQRNEAAPEYCQGTITDLPIDSNSIDLVVCLGVIGYIEKEELGVVMTEFNRVLKPGGQLIMSFANQLSPYRSFRQFYYYNLLEMGKKITGLGEPVTSGYNTYSPNTVREALQAADFSPKEFCYLTFSTGIWNTNLNVSVYNLFDRHLKDCDLLGRLAMTWVVDARKPAI